MNAFDRVSNNQVRDNEERSKYPRKCRSAIEVSQGVFDFSGASDEELFASEADLIFWEPDDYTDSVVRAYHSERKKEQNKRIAALDRKIAEHAARVIAAKERSHLQRQTGPGNLRAHQFRRTSHRDL